MRVEYILANLALVVLFAVVAWDIAVWFHLVNGHTITHEIRSTWRGWAFFVLAGTVAGGHFLTGK